MEKYFLSTNMHAYSYIEWVWSDLSGQESGLTGQAGWPLAALLLSTLIWQPWFYQPWFGSPGFINLDLAALVLSTLILCPLQHFAQRTADPISHTGDFLLWTPPTGLWDIRTRYCQLALQGEKLVCKGIVCNVRVLVLELLKLWPQDWHVCREGTLKQIILFRILFRFSLSLSLSPSLPLPLPLPLSLCTFTNTHPD